jgi:hypothetical protein
MSAVEIDSAFSVSEVGVAPEAGRWQLRGLDVAVWRCQPSAAVRDRPFPRISDSLGHSASCLVDHQLPPWMLTFGPPGDVYVENEWYDGPRAGIADVNGLPHRFASQWDEASDEYLDTFLVWPVAPAELALEQEQWAIFVSWNDQYEAAPGPQWKRKESVRVLKVGYAAHRDHGQNAQWTCRFRRCRSGASKCSRFRRRAAWSAM